MGRAWDVDQSWLLPRSVDDFVPAGHLAHFVRDTVREALDLSAVLGAYEEERGHRQKTSDGRPPDRSPPDRAQRNFTDPDSRIQPTGCGFIAGYNGQIAVDAAHQVIVAHRLSTHHRLRSPGRA